MFFLLLLSSILDNEFTYHTLKCTTIPEIFALDNRMIMYWILHVNFIFSYWHFWFYERKKLTKICIIFVTLWLLLVSLIWKLVWEIIFDWISFLWLVLVFKFRDWNIFYINLLLLLLVIFLLFLFLNLFLLLLLSWLLIWSLLILILILVW